MKQTGLDLYLNTRHSRRQVSFEEMSHVMPWADLLAHIAPHVPRAKTGTVVHAQSGFVQTVIATAANVNNVTQGHALGKAPRRKAHALGRIERTSRKAQGQRARQGGTFRLMSGYQAEFWT